MTTYERSRCKDIVTVSLKNDFFEDTSAFVDNRYRCFGLLVTSAPGYKAVVYLCLVCFIICTQLICRVYLWCDIYWPFDSQYCSQVFLIHLRFQALVGLDRLLSHRNVC